MNLQLSDGTTLQIPDDASPEAIRNFAARGEAHIKANPRPAAAAAPAEPDPYSTYNTVGRIGTDAVLGIPDLGIAAYNAFVAPEGGRVTPLGVRARGAMGVEELPEDAGWLRRILESGASALPTGGAGLARGVTAGVARAGMTGGLTGGARTFGTTIAAPTVASDAGAQIGGAIGGEKGALIGGVLGGGATAAKPLADRWIQGRYVGKGDPNAPEIQAAADRLGIETTPGAIGNWEIQKRENQYAADYPQGRAAVGQDRIRNQMTGVGEDIGAQRGGTNASPAAIGEDITAATTQRVAEDTAYAGAQQENLQRTVGDQAPVRVIDIINEARQVWPHLTRPARDAIQHRIVNDLYPLISQRDARGNPIIGPNTTVPYELVKGWRTELGQSFDQGRIPRNTSLYEPTTNAMGDTAAAAGVPRGDFNAVQDFYRGVHGEGGLTERLAPFEKESGTVHDYTLGESGLKRPERLETFATETAGDPRHGNIFGSFLQNKVADTLGANTAQGPNKFAQFVEGADPRAIDTIGGAQAPRVRDLATVARGVDVPTSQRGIGRSTGGVMNTLGGKFLGSEILGQVGQAVDPILGPVFRGAGWLARPTIDRINQRIMESEAARRGMLGQAPLSNRMTLNELAHILNVIGQNQPQEQ